MLQDILKKHEIVFKEELGTLKGATAKIHVVSGAEPHFFKSRSLPFAMREKVEAELDRLIKEHIIEPVKFQSGQLLWCLCWSQMDQWDSVEIIEWTVNRESSLEQYPIPRMEDMFAVLSGGEKYTN